MIKNVFRKNETVTKKDRELFDKIKETAAEWIPFVDSESVRMHSGYLEVEFDFPISDHGNIPPRRKLRDLEGIICAAMDVNSCTIQAEERSLVLTIPRKSDELGDIYLGGGIDGIAGRSFDGVTAYLGEKVEGGPAYIDFSTEPHMLMCGTTGAGRTTALYAMLLSMCYKYSPAELEIYGADAMGTFASTYEDEPHTKMTAKDEAGYREVVTAVHGIVRERSGGSGAGSFDEEGTGTLPQVFLVMEEAEAIFGERSGNSKEHRGLRDMLQYIAKEGRSCGVHVILTTHLADSKNIAPAIAAQMGNRLALRVTERCFSRQIIGQAGAERLPRGGRCLFKTLPVQEAPDSATDEKPDDVLEIQCAFSEPEEWRAAVAELAAAAKRGPEEWDVPGRDG